MLNINTLCERVHAGRHGLAALGYRLPDADLFVVVSPEDWATLLLEASGPVDKHHRPSPLDRQGGAWYVMGLSIRPSSDLAPGKIAFRAEVFL